MKKLRVKTFFVYGMGVFAVIFIIILMMLSPLFNVTRVIIEGNERVSSESIQRSLGLGAPSAVNIFLFERSGALNRLNNPYIESVSIDKAYFAREITVTVVERRLAGFVEFAQGQYLYIDEYGLVLEAATSISERLPIIVGLNLSGFTVGAPLEVGNEHVLRDMREISRVLSRHEIESDVIRVDVNDSSNIRLFIDGLVVSFGDTTDGDRKMQMLIQILNHFEGEDIRGTLDISDISRNPILRHLT